MRVLHFSYDHVDNPWCGGGGAIRTQEIYSRLAARGHRCTIAFGAYPGAHEHESGGLRQLPLGLGATPAISAATYLLSAWRYLLRHGREYDVVVEDFSFFCPILVPLLRRMPSVIQLQLFGSEELLDRFGVLAPVFRTIQRRYPLRYRNAIFLTPTLADRWPDREQRRYFIGMGIPDDYLATPATRGDYLLYLGRLSARAKGLDTLAAACKRLWSQGVDCRVVIAGKGGDERLVRELLTNGPVDGRRVEFTGFVTGEEKLRLLAGCRALLLPSREEGEGLCIIEAAACAKPAIVSDIAELSFVEQNGLGWTFPVGDDEALVDRMRDVLTDEASNNRVGEIARAWASRRTWDRQAEAFEAALREIVAGESRGGRDPAVVGCDRHRKRIARHPEASQ